MEVMFTCFFFFSLTGQPDSTVNEVFSRVRREASSADTSSAKDRRHERRSLEFCYWLIWVSWWDWVMVFVVSHCFMRMFWERYFILSAVTTLRSKLGTNFVPPKISIEEYDTTPLRTHAQPRNEESWSPWISSKADACNSFATGFRVVTQSEREYFCLQPFAHIISVSRNLEAKWYHIHSEFALLFLCMN